MNFVFPTYDIDARASSWKPYVVNKRSAKTCKSVYYFCVMVEALR